MPPMRKALLAVSLLIACSSSPDSAPPDAARPDASAPDAAPETATVHHSFGAYHLEPGQEVTNICIQWTLENDEPIYVQAATLSNDGFYHHSNWTVVPEDMFPGDDGFFTCSDRGFDQVSAAIAGTVLMAQSTQSVQESQRFPEGMVVKIPPHHKLVAGAHLLNTSDEAVDTELRMALEIIHPRLVKNILVPFHLDDLALSIPAHAESRFVLPCNLSDAYESAAGHPLDLKIRFVLPHFHYKGNFWRLEIIGGPHDGEVIHQLDGFSADAGGIAFDPPIDLTGATGLKMTCGYFNNTDQDVIYGVGENEMCEMLGLAESDALLDASAHDIADNDVVTTDGVKIATATKCSVIGIPPNASQTLPTDGEKNAPLYVPASDDPGVDTTPDCEDTASDAVPDGDATLTNIASNLFTPRCSFNACHGGDSPQNDLDLSAGADLHTRLINHEPVFATDLPFITPGDPEGSFLYQMISRCEPHDGAGNVLPHMPLNSPALLSPGLVARVRVWIENGALDN